MIQTIKAPKERFRPNQDTLVYTHDTNVDLTKYRIVGYLSGERINLSPALRCEHFDQIQTIGFSENTKTGSKYLHAIGMRFKEKSSTILIFSLR